MFYFDVKPFGNWAMARNASSTLPQTIKRSIRSAEEKVAKKLIKIVKGHIQNQDLNWVPLSPQSIKRKGHDKVYIFTGTYLNSIKFWQKNYTVHIGIPRGIYEPRNRIELWKIATWMETGMPSRNLPARPVWGPSVEELGGRGGMQEIIEETLRRKLSREGWDIDLPFL